MLLNYLYSNFLETSAFAAACDTSEQTLADGIQARILPAPSYEYQSNARSVSFVSTADDTATYRFHLKGHVAWHRDVMRFGLTSEDRARSHFFDRYDQAKKMFFTSDLGKQLADTAPHIPDVFDDTHATATWAHFLNGVYGVCTRDGQPDSVFLKQAGVMFIDQMIADGPPMSRDQLNLLARAVHFLDAVESDFAPHEAPQASRQRCIVDVKARFFDTVAA